jgi:hypothetical protein
MDAHRCERCGRRLAASTARPAPEVYPTLDSRALMPEFEERPHDPIPQASSGATAPRRAPVQPNLFPVREQGRVVPIAAYQPRQERRSKHERRTMREDAPQSDPRHDDLQGTFVFTPRQRGEGAAPVRDTKAPVAIPVHRALACMVDLSLILIAIGLAISVLYFLAGEEFLRSHALPVVGAITGIFVTGYKLLFAVADMDSPGLRWTQLRLLNFNGELANREERLKRLFFGLLSVLPGGLGLVWCLVDEETLTWHCHSSRTFLTSYSGTPGQRH